MTSLKSYDRITKTKSKPKQNKNTNAAVWQHFNCRRNLSGMSTVSVDFGKKTGLMKQVHGVNNGPKTHLFALDTSEYFVKAGIPYSRLHDTEYPYGSGHFVDIPAIFPDFDADPDNPQSYDFTFTDLYLKAIYDAGTKVFYRLGVSIEHGPKKYHIFPPKDPLKWAKICEKIIRHYNEGWADGFHYGIEYWEIWNEPENPPMWQGTKEEFFKLYSTAAKYLKKTFPNLKIGGYASCGFYGCTRPDASDFLKSFVPYLHDFLKYITAEKTKAPLDFFSWHIYTTSVEELKEHTLCARSILDQYGLRDTESILNEWNIAADFETMKMMRGAAMAAGTLCVLQKSPVELGMYYDSQPKLEWCGLFHFPSLKPAKTYYSFAAFNELFKLKNEVASESDCTSVYSCAAGDGKEGAVLLSNYDGQNEKVTIKANGISVQNGCRAEFYLLDEQNDLKFYDTIEFKGESFEQTVNLNTNTVILIKIKEQ